MRLAPALHPTRAKRWLLAGIILRRNWLRSGSAFRDFLDHASLSTLHPPLRHSLSHKQPLSPMTSFSFQATAKATDDDKHKPGVGSRVLHEDDQIKVWEMV